MRRRRRVPSGKHPSESALPPQVRKWVLRILVPLNGHRDFIRRDEFADDALARALGLGAWVDSPEGFDPKAALRELRKLYDESEKARSSPSGLLHLRGNVGRLAKVIGLSAVESEILAFAVVLHGYHLLAEATDWLGGLGSTRDVSHVLSVILDLPEKDVRPSLSPRGVLIRSGLLKIDSDRSYALKSKLDLLSAAFADRILSSDDDPVGLLRDMVSISSPAELGLSDYEHIAPELSILRPYFRKSLAEAKKGVNILVSGMPGTGKTELAKVIAHDLGCDLIEVASEDEDGDPVDGEDRLRAFRLAQRLFAQRAAILLFDEVEDILNDRPAFFRKRAAVSNKAWLNRALEENPVPTVWIANSIQGCDPAFVRRFDAVFELPVPPRQQRERIIRGKCDGLLDETAVRRLSESDSLAPAVVERAVSVVRAVKSDIEIGADAAVELLINRTLEAQGHGQIRKHDSNRLPDIYDAAFINADFDPAQIAESLARAKSGRLCLYGPPGTGKTAYGHWIAERMGAPLLIRRASDLLSKWVGGNEKNIARAFRDAERQGAILMIDEVDSFLHDRREAHRSWEVSLVNEMLTQMESFSGVFIASTNLMDGLDPATLRRFDVKVHFDYLRSEQARKLFRRYCARHGLPEPAAALLTRLAGLKKLTAGDFATVFKQSLFRPILTCEELLAALQAECALKEGARGIGFVQ